MKFSFKKPLVRYFNCLNGLIQQIESHIRFAKACLGRGEMAEIKRVTVTSRVGLVPRNCLVHKLDPLFGITTLRQQRSLRETCPVLEPSQSVFDTVC